MVNYKYSQLDLVFAALSDATRRSVLTQLGGGSCTISELAQPHEMSLPGLMKHLAVLEAAGLIARSKQGRVVSCQLNAAPMQEAANWISRYEQFWTGQLDALGRYLYHQQEVTPWTETSKRRDQAQPENHPPPRSRTKTNTTTKNKNNSKPKSASPGTTASPPKKSGARGPTPKR